MKKNIKYNYFIATKDIDIKILGDSKRKFLKGNLIKVLWEELFKEDQFLFESLMEKRIIFCINRDAFYTLLPMKSWKRLKLFYLK
jgi:hypothetical protein